MTAVHVDYPEQLRADYARMRHDIRQVVKILQIHIAEGDLDPDEALTLALVACCAAPERACTLAAVLLIDAALK